MTVDRYIVNKLLVSHPELTILDLATKDWQTILELSSL